MQEPLPTSKKLTVFFDGACPICDREISTYKQCTGANKISWIDVSRATDAEIAPGLRKDEALARFHVLRTDGSLVSGGEAFAAIWAALPRFRLLGQIIRMPPLPWFLNWAYDIFLKARPRLQVYVQQQGKLREPR
jgi:predicted DCC family thiol-disulfide oxidoreductase YuxK